MIEKRKKKKNWLFVFMTVFILSIIIPTSSALSGVGITAEAAAKPSINKKKVTLKFGKRVTLKVKNANKKVKWTSSKPSVAKVQSTKGKRKQNAVIKATGKGKAVITAKMGRVKLKVRITVKHTHSYTYPATCTTPARCICGKTYGVALGHNMSMATCQKPATCVRCGVTNGTKADHNYRDFRCIWCNQLNLKELVSITPRHTSATGDYNVRWISLVIENTGTSTFLIKGGTTTGLIYPDANSAPLTVYLTNSSDEALLWHRTFPGNRTTTYFDTMNTNLFTFTPNGKLVFTASYGDQDYRITLRIDGDYDFELI